MGDQGGQHRFSVRVYSLSLWHPPGGMSGPQGGGGGTFCPSGRGVLRLARSYLRLSAYPGGDTGSMGQVVLVYILPVAGKLYIA